MSAATMSPLEAEDLVLCKIDAARHLLAEARTIQDAKHILDAAEAARVYAKRRDASTEIVNRAGEIKIEAEHLLGQMLAQTPDAKPGPKNNSVEGLDSIPSLKLIGISKDLSARAQRLAAIPIAAVHQAIEEQKADNVEITTAGTVRHLVAAEPATCPPISIRKSTYAMPKAFAQVDQAINILAAIPREAGGRRAAFDRVYGFLLNQYPRHYGPMQRTKLPPTPAKEAA